MTAVNAIEESSEIKDSLQRLAVARAYDKKQISLKTARRAISAVEHFHFAFTAITSSRSSGGISQMYARRASAIANVKPTGKKFAPGELAHRIGQEVEELIGKLRAKRPSRDEFIAEFRNLGASEKLTRAKPLVQYVLNRLSEHQGGVAFDRKRMTIEHLSPQGGKGLKQDVVAEIGNLAWVSEDAQKQLGTKKIDSKISTLRAKHFWVDEKLKTHVGPWDKKAIRARTDHLAELAYDHVWPIT